MLITNLEENIKKIMTFRNKVQLSKFCFNILCKLFKNGYDGIMCLILVKQEHLRIHAYN